MLSEPRRYKRPGIIARLSARLDCSPAMVWLMAVLMGYVGILVAWCVRHAVAGAW